VPAQPSTTLLILGAGGHGRVVADAALAQGAWAQLRATDGDRAKCVGELLPGVPLALPEEAERQSGAVHIAIGLASAREREALAARLPLATVIHPRACVSAHAQIGAGVFVAAQAVVAPLAQVGRCTIINHGAVVDHDAEVGEFTHIAPLVALSGRARIGSRVLVGAGAQVLPGVRVGDDVVIGAGAVVHQDIDGPGVYAGVPARRVR
jgi:sugar O-acyltransferase (sialic acid O-acetyltransferase NeuD family)